MRHGALPVALLVVGALAHASAAPAQGLPTYGCHDVDHQVSELGPEKAAKAFACWIDRVRMKELGHVAHIRLDSRLSRAARSAVASGHFGLRSVKRYVRRAGYVAHRHHGRRGRWRVARAAPALLSDGVTPLQIGDDVLWHDAGVFAPPFRDIGVAIKGNVFFAIAAVRDR